MGEIHDLVERFGRTRARKPISDRTRRRLIEIASEVLQDENQAIVFSHSRGRPSAPGSTQAGPVEDSVTLPSHPGPDP